MKIKIDKEQKLEAEIELQELILKIDDELIYARVDQRRLELKKPICDKCVFKISQAEKQRLLHEHLTEGLVVTGSEYTEPTKLFDKLVVDMKKQCSFCFIRLFESQKESFYKKNLYFLYERAFQDKYTKPGKNRSNLEKLIIRYICIMPIICIVLSIILFLQNL
jgi:hypothetical protein